MQLQKMGRWKGATFKEYIQDELTSYALDMSKAMKQKFNYVNIASSAFANVDDITQSTIKQEYAPLRKGPVVNAEGKKKGQISVCNQHMSNPRILRRLLTPARLADNTTKGWQAQ